MIYWSVFIDTNSSFTMSYIRNTTFIVERSQIERFAEWAQQVFVKAAHESGLFSDITMTRILTEVDPEAVNFAIQMKAHNLETHESWHRDVALPLKERIVSQLGANRLLFFTTDMEIIDILQ